MSESFEGEELRLYTDFTLWMMNLNNQSVKKTDENYSKKLEKILNFSTGEEFLEFYLRMKKPKDMIENCEVFVFKKNVKPLWEDPMNNGGGRFFLHIKKTYADKIWQNLLFSFLGGEDKEVEFVNGLIMRVLKMEVVFFVWARKLDDEEVEELKNWIKNIVGLSKKIRLEYKVHTTGN